MCRLLFRHGKTRRRRRRKKKERWHLPHKLGEVPGAHSKAWGLKIVAWVGYLFIPRLCCVCNLRGFAAGCPKDVLACFKKSVGKARPPAASAQYGHGQGTECSKGWRWCGNPSCRIWRRNATPSYTSPSTLIRYCCLTLAHGITILLLCVAVLRKPVCTERERPEGRGCSFHIAVRW